MKYRISVPMSTVPEVENGAAEGLIDAVVDHLFGQIGILAADFADAVEDHDRVVDRVADDRQQRGHDRQADLEIIDQQKAEERRQVFAERQEPDRDQHVVDQGQHGRDAEHRVLKPNPDVESRSSPGWPSARDRGQQLGVARHLAANLIRPAERPPSPRGGL